MTSKMAHRSTLHAGALPYWMDSVSFPVFGTIDRDIEVDVVVVGGGITGLTTAYLLLTAGRSVALLERARCAAIDTGHTSAHLTMVTDVRVNELARRLGRTHAQAVWDAGLAAIAQIEGIVQEHQIGCGFERVDGYLHAPKGEPSRAEADTFSKEADLASELGFDAGFVEDVPLIGGPGIRFEHQARFHPRRYLAGIAEAVRAGGGLVYEDSAVDEFCEDPFGVRANGHLVRCADVVLATHNPPTGLISDAGTAALFQTKLALYTSYVIAGRVPRRTVLDALFWDTGDPYQYLRVEGHRDHDLVILGGEDHKTGQVSDTNACYDRLERALVARVPEVSLSHRWSGQVIETPDGLPYIGQMAEHRFVATGFAGNGLTFGTLAAIIIADAIRERQNPWAELFNPGRLALGRGLWDYLKENADYPYYMMRDRFAGADGRSLRSVQRGQGKVIEYRGAKVAASRDSAGVLTLRSAICTHMGCLVAWNESDRTWDCPCHGSRFTPRGDIISGPAGAPLRPANT